MWKRMMMALVFAAFCVCICDSSSRAVSDWDSFGVSGDVSSWDNAYADPWAESESRVRVSDTMYYEVSLGDFVYPVGDDGFEVRSNAADGMIMTETVTVSPSGCLAVTIYRNGEVVDFSGMAWLSDAGNYTVTVKTGSDTETLFSFTIVNQLTSIAGGYVLPDGFYIQYATLNGEDVYYDYAYIDMAEDGLYHIEYICGATMRPYTLEVTVDNTPPELILNGRVDERGRYHSAVDVSSTEEIASLTITRDEQAISFPSDGHITDSGMYTIQAFDRAGNAVTVQFTILIYFDVNSFVFFGLVILSVVSVRIYILYKRKRLKII